MKDSEVTVTIARDTSEYSDVTLPESILVSEEGRRLIVEYIESNGEDDSAFNALPPEVREALDAMTFQTEIDSTTSNYRMMDAIRDSDEEELFGYEEIPMTVDDFVNNTSPVKAMPDSIEIPEFGISICGNQLQVTESGRPKGDILLAAAVDAIHSHVLAQHMAGIDVTSKEYIESLRTTFDALGNNLEEFNSDNSDAPDL